MYIIVLPTGIPRTMQEFPVFRDRMPTQLLSYMRLTRIQDPAQLASVRNLPVKYMQLSMRACMSARPDSDAAFYRQYCMRR